MRLAPPLALMFLLLSSLPAHAQHSGAPPAAPATTAPAEARQFDFLIGQWELEVHPKVSGLAAMIHGAPRLLGSWKAWRAFDGFGVEDELRIMDASGNPLSLSYNQRVYSEAEKQWKLGGLDVYRARFSTATARFEQGEMRVTGQGVDPEGKSYRTRTRFYEIGKDAFRMQQDRSYDDGATWTEAALAIDAKRVSATAPR